MKVGKLTIEQKNSLIGQQFAQDCYFNPIQDLNDNWVISPEEMNGRITNPNFFWVRDLPLIEYQPNPSEIL
jgi:hypothetical protein